MKSALILALAVSLVAASPNVQAGFNFSATQWITAQIYFIIYNLVLPIYVLIGTFEALVGSPAYFNTAAADLITGMYALPSYAAINEAQGW